VPCTLRTSPLGSMDHDKLQLGRVCKRRCNDKSEFQDSVAKKPRLGSLSNDLQCVFWKVKNAATFHADRNCRELPTLYQTRQVFVICLYHKRLTDNRNLLRSIEEVDELPEQGYCGGDRQK